MCRIAIIPKTTWLTTALAVVMSFSAIAQELHLQFENVVNGKRIALDTVTYTNALGQSYTVSNLKYYISNIRLTTLSGQVLSDSGYYLIREDDPSSMAITLHHIPQGAYSKITFLVGVDSLHNCSGAQSDALDPVNGMFWTWNTGYIFFKLEGKSSASKNPGGIYEYHIGGYKAPANCIRSVSLTLESGAGDSPDMVDAPKGKNQAIGMKSIYIHADIAKIIDKPTPLDMARYNSVTDFHNAAMIADRYQHLFSLDHVVYGE